MSAQEIIAELAKLKPEELRLVKEKLDRPASFSASAFRKDNDRVGGRDQPANHSPFPRSRRAHGPNRSAVSLTQR